MLLVKGLATLLGLLVWRLMTAATAIFLVRMAWTGLWRVYPALTALFAADLLENLIRLRFSRYDSNVYFVGNAVELPLAVFALAELTRAGFVRHPALARFSRKASWHLVGVCAVLGALSLFLDPAVPPDRSPLLHYFITIQRAVTSGLLVFVLVLGAFMLWFPVAMRRNVAWFLGGFCAIFSANWFSLLVSNRSPEWTLGFSGIVGDGVSFLCLLYWTIAVRPSGESVFTIVGHRWNEAEMSRVSGQLDAIHDRLVRLNQ